MRVKLNKCAMKWLMFCMIPFFVLNFVYGQDVLSQKHLTVLKVPADTMMKSYLTKIVDRQFAIRDSLLSTLKSARDWDRQSLTIRDSMISWTGSFPDRTPLNARITGRIEREDYIIEKILFESRPNYYVSGNLYLPKNVSFPVPAHFNVIGHAATGKADERYQRMSIAQAKNGFVVFTIDQLGQGERQVAKYTSWASAPGNAHKILGIQAFISGTHIFNFMVWDAIRAIDYMVSRPEIDSDKICMTGSSGGGMMTTYILPFDNRVTVSVPTCNPNTWSYRVHANLGTDHEQVFFGAFESNIDPRGDPLFIQVPKPLLLNTTTDDQLNPPRGVWDLSTWLFKSYSVHGVPEKFDVTMVKAPHAYNKEQREITYSWMMRWTGKDAANFWEEDFPIEKEGDLWAAPSGSVFNVPDSKQTHMLVLDYLNVHKAIWRKVKTEEAVKKHKVKMKGLITQLLNDNFSDRNFNCNFKEKRRVEDITIQPFILNPEPDILLPGVLLKPESNISISNVILYINENGKNEILKDLDLVKSILNKGNSICAIDLRGMGETSPDMADKFWDFLSGKPIFGQRVRDVLTVLQWLKESEIKAQNIKYWGTGMCALYGAFAGVLSENISGFFLEEPLISFESVIKVDIPEYNKEILLPGVLDKFDMAQVYQSLCPNPVLIMNPLSGDKTAAGKNEIENLEKQVSITYRGLKSSKNWNILNVSDSARRQVILNNLTNE